MTVRELRWEDFDALVESYWELYEERERGEPIGIGLFEKPPTRAEEAVWFAGVYSRVAAGEEIAVIAEAEGRAVGMCSVRSTFPGGRSSDGGHVGELGILVDYRHRGQGHGRAMIVRALELARARFDVVRLWVFSTNVGAKRLYERLGFVTTGRMPLAVHRGSTYIDTELMYIDLRSGAAPAPAEKR